MAKGRERDASKRTQLMEQRSADELDQTVEVPSRARGSAALPFVAPPAGKGAPAAHPLPSKKPAHDPLEGTVQLGPETTRQVTGKAATPFRGRRSPTREVSTAAVTPPTRAAAATSEARAPETPASAPRRRAQSWEAPAAKPASVRAAAKPASVRAAPAAPAPPPAAKSAAPRSTRAAEVAPARPPRTPQELRAQARALDELCGSADSDLERIKRRRASASQLEEADLGKMRDVLRWLGEALQSGDGDDRKRLEELWRVVAPVTTKR